MHTTLCAFEDKARAEQARDELLRAGFARHDVHVEHRHAAAEARDANDRWDGLEREVAMDRSALSSFGHFFTSLFGRDNPHGHADRYSQRVERGEYVLVVDAHDAAEADRARSILHGLQAGDLDVVHRAEQRPLRDVVAMRQERGTAGMVDRSRDVYEGTLNEPSIERERAMASADRMRPGAGPDLREPDIERAPGLRYADKDKPL